MNGLFYLDEIFYSENSPYLYDIDTFSELQPSRVPFMANGRELEDLSGLEGYDGVCGGEC